MVKKGEESKYFLKKIPQCGDSLRNFYYKISINSCELINISLSICSKNYIRFTEINKGSSLRLYIVQLFQLIQVTIFSFVKIEKRLELSFP